MALTVAYCRVSTEEQAAEGFSIEGQADKLKVYAELHDLGGVVVITDPGRSGKDLDRPGLQRLIRLVDAGEVGNLLVWRLDRLSRNLGDLVLLADRFGQANVALHSFCERIDLSTATGRMFYNVLGSFAQFYREQLVENVRMGMQQAVREGKWINRPKTGYDLVGGVLVPNADAPLVKRIFRLRSEGLSHRAIEDRTGIKYSTVRAILHSRIYLGEVLLSGTWYPGTHQSLVSPELFEAAHRGHVPGRRRGRQLLSGRVRCGLCRRLAAVEYNPRGIALFRCRHRGRGCEMPRRAASALERAALLGLRLVGRDERLQEAVRSELEAALAQAAKRQAQGPTEHAAAVSAAVVESKRRKLLELYYADKISPDLFATEEARLRAQLDALQGEEVNREQAVERQQELREAFERVVALLEQLDLDALWASATDAERRVLVEELLEEVAIFPDHLEVVVAGAPRLNVLLEEVGLRRQTQPPKAALQTVGVGGGT